MRRVSAARVLARGALLSAVVLAALATGFAPERAQADDRVRGLVEKLDSSNSMKVRLTAVMLLGSLNDEAAVEPLLKVADDPAFALRGAAVVALGRIGSANGIPTLFARLDDSDQFVRDQATKALRLVAEKPAGAQVLLGKARSGSPAERSRAIEVLSGVQNAGALQIVVTALGDENKDLAKVAADNLNARAPNEMGPLLTQTFYSQTPALRSAAVAFAAQFDWAKASTDDTPGADAPVEPVLNALAMLVLNDVPGPEQQAATQALTKLAKFIAPGSLTRTITQSSDARARERAVYLAFVRNGDEQALQVLVNALTDSDAGVRSKAAQYLGQSGAKRFVPELKNAQKVEKNERVREVLAKAVQKLEGR